MSDISFNNFGYVASKEVDSTILASRYSHQKQQEKLIFLDVIEKLRISPLDDILDIGSGPGLLTIPLSYIANTVTAIDHPDVLNEIKKSNRNNIQLMPGNFLELDVQQHFDKIVIYSVLHYLQSREEVLMFVERAIKLLKKGGILMVGDLANIPKQERYFSTEKGCMDEIEFNQSRSVMREKQADSIVDFLDDRARDTRCVTIDDDLVVDILLLARKKGCESYIAPQKEGLPFSFYREDILVYSK